MADVVARSTEPTLGAIKLAWWRERLEELDRGIVPAEPRLQAAAAELLPRGVTGAMLAGLEDGWLTFFEEEHDIERVGDRGANLFAMAARLLGGSGERLDPAGRLFAYEQATRRGLMEPYYPMDEMHILARHRFPAPLRPLTALACLAARDVRQSPRFEPEATPGRALALIVHGLTGRV